MLVHVTGMGRGAVATNAEGEAGVEGVLVHCD